MKTPSDFGVDPYGARNGKGIYAFKWANYYDAERYLEKCRTRFAEDIYHAEPLPSWDGFSQQFLEVAKREWKKGGDESLLKYFSEFADYVIENLPLYNEIEEWAIYNSRVIAYNDYVCEQSNGTITYDAEQPDYICELLNWFPANWRTYWKYCGHDCQRVGGNFRYTYNWEDGRDKWGERDEHFNNVIAKVFIDKIEEALNKRKAIIGK